MKIRDIITESDDMFSNERIASARKPLIKKIKKLYGEIYDFGDEGLDYAAEVSPLFRESWNKYEEVNEVDPFEEYLKREPFAVLEKLAQHMTEIVEELQGDLAEEFLNEAGEPDNPSRRGFLRGLAGAAATAAMPGGVANLVKTAPATAAAAATATASVADMLFNTALAIGSDQGFSKSGSWFDDDEDSEEDEWDKTLEEPQGNHGEMPWGEYYEIGETPGGVPYLHTSDSPDGNFGVFTFMDNGKPQYILIAWERGGFSEVQDASDPKYTKRWHNVEDSFEGDPAEIIDAVVNPENDKPAGAKAGVDNGTKLYALLDKNTGQSVYNFRAANDEEAIKTVGEFDKNEYKLAQTDDWINGKAKEPRVVDITASGPSPADIARLAGLAGKAAGTTQPAPAQQQKPAQQALPAPTAPNVLEPEIGKQKQKVPVNKNASR